MKWKCFGCVVLLSLTGTTALAQNDILFTVQAPLQTVSPVADGTVNEGEYSYSLFLSFVDRENPGYPWPNLDHMCPAKCDLDGGSPDAMGDDDLSATMYLAHTDEFLFLAFDVTDGFLDYSGVGAGDAFKNDAVELYIDADADGADGHGGAAGPYENFQIVADASDGAGGPALDPDDIEFNNRFADRGIIPAFEAPPLPGEFYSAGLVHSETNYVIEWQIPLESLDVEDGDGFTAASTGDTLRFQAVIDDNDYEGSQGQDTYGELWYVEGDPNSAWGGAEGNWVVGLELSEAATTTPGDYNGDDMVNAADVDLQSAAMKDPNPDLGKFDENKDGSVNELDRLIWVHDHAGTWVGDADLNGMFDSSDFVTVFTAGLYETETMAGWAEGDWNGDMLFDSSDFVAAFTDGGYEMGTRPPAAAAVPEPSAVCLLFLGAMAALGLRRRKF